MKLYDNKSAPNPRRVRIFLAEKGVEVPTEQVDIAGKQNRAAEYQKLNPLSGVPILELDDGTIIAETVAICRYFEETKPNPPLFGATPKEKAMVEMWNRRLELNVCAPIYNAFRHSNAFFAGRIEQVPQWGEQQGREAAQMMDWFDGALGDRKFAAGDNYSIADITALCAFDFARVIRVKIDPDKHKNLSRWHQAVSARPSAKA
ncbi:MAG: glutathione S-transferase family protein [Rhodospirillales bacterium]